MIEIVESVSALLWAIVGITGGIIVLWFMWQLLQIGHNLREYGVDYIGFLRGEIHSAADEEGVEILRPNKHIRDRRGRIRKILQDKDTTKKE